MLSEYEVSALLLSLKVSGVAVLFSLPPGILLAWILARYQFPGKSLLDSLIHLPLVLPPVVIGYLLLVSMGKQGIIGSALNQWFGWSFSFSWRGAALAAAIVASPLLVKAIRLSLENIDIKYEQAARTLGASPLKVFFTISLPLTTPGILAGTVLAFARCIGEFGATITFVSNIPGETRTLPLAMYSFIETPGAEAEAARLCIIAIILALTSLLLADWLSKRVQQRFSH